jgi:hypothetical protein
MEVIALPFLEQTVTLTNTVLSSDILTRLVQHVRRKDEFWLVRGRLDLR